MSLPPSNVVRPPVIARWEVTDAECEAMSWHDVPIHGILHTPETGELAFDIDYLLQWLEPAEGTASYRMWSVPATLIFHDVCRFIADVEPAVDWVLTNLSRSDAPIDLDISIPRDSPPLHWWALECPVGSWRVLAAGFTQYYRGVPVLTTGGRIDASIRGPTSFARARGADVG